MTERGERCGAKVIPLRPREVQHVDPDRIGALYTEAGPLAAESAICRTVEILERRLGTLDCGSPEGALRVVGLAEGVGLMTLAHCARGAAEAANTGDPVASAAAFARLRRAGNGALGLVWGAGPQGA